MDYSEINNLLIENEGLVLDSLKLSTDLDGSIRCPCPIHGGDNPTGFKYNPKTKKWTCFTRHCEQEYGSNLVGLIRGIHQYSYVEAVNWIAELLSSSNVKINKDLFRIQSLIRQEQPEEIKILRPIDNTEAITGDIPYFINRGFSREALKYFGAFQSNNFLHPQYGRAAFLLYDCDGNIVGTTGRKTEITDKSLIKWRHHPINIDINGILFGFWQNKQDIIDSQTSFIVEGPLDVVRMWEAGFKNTVGLLGTNFSRSKLERLLSNKIHTIYTMFDPDDSGQKACIKFNKENSKYFKIHNIVPSNDPGDLSIQDLKGIISEFYN